MKHIKIFILFLLPLITYAQTDPTWGYINKQQADSFRRSLPLEKNDTLLMAAYRSLGFYYQEIKLDSALYFHKLQLEQAKKLDIKMWLADAYQQLGSVYGYLSNISESNESLVKAQEITNSKKNETSNWHYRVFSNARNLYEARISILGLSYNDYGNLYRQIGEKEKAIASFKETIALGKQINNGKLIGLGYGNLSQFYDSDTCILYARMAIDYNNKAGIRKFSGNGMLRIAGAYARMGKRDSALYYVYAGIETARAQNNLRTLSSAYDGIAEFYFSQQQVDSSLFYAGKLLDLATYLQSPDVYLDAYSLLASIYDDHIKNKDSAYKYQKLAYNISDSLNEARIKQLTGYQKFAFNEQTRLRKINDDKTAYQDKLKWYAVLAVLAVLFGVAIILYRNNRQKQKANKVLEETLNNLKATQAQLVQSEKMASLGELTAGIAHEIQNPLNFVNNFSEVSNELADEMNEELNKGDIEEAKAIAADIKGNLEKINHHGKRADAIVKGMLQHSRKSEGQKEPTDINALCEEYLRLSYHGLRAKDKSFNATLKTDLDESIGKINIIPQDMGRVIMNLLTNAFYAVNAKTLSGLAYEPTVSISTKKTGNEVQVVVADNGNGIPANIIEKIFQPFFTTKPTGSGTGLGLSLSYDIIKAHGGTLKVDTEEGEYTRFIINLPL